MLALAAIDMSVGTSIAVICRMQLRPIIDINRLLIILTTLIVCGLVGCNEYSADAELEVTNAAAEKIPCASSPQIRSQEELDWVRAGEIDTPLRRLSDTAYREFRDSLEFKDGELVTFRSEPIAGELTDAEIREIMGLLGVGDNVMEHCQLVPKAPYDWECLPGTCEGTCQLAYYPLRCDCIMGPVP